MAGSKFETRIFAVIILVAAVFFAWLIFKPEKPKEEQPIIIKMVDLSEFRSLPISIFANLCFVNLTVNGTSGYFLVDTGAEESVFNYTYLDSLHIAMADSIPIPNTKIYRTDTMSIISKADSLFKFDKQFFTYPLNGLHDKITEADSTFREKMFFGILGQDLMRQEGMILNFQNNKIYLTNKYNKIE